jgi:hypothetical protein
MITSGRTVGEAGDLPIEAMVRSRGGPHGLNEDQLAVMDLCSKPISIAEVAVGTSFVLGVARVLVADLTASGHLEMYETVTVEDTAIVRRLLDGIRAL